MAGVEPQPTPFCVSALTPRKQQGKNGASSCSMGTFSLLCFCPSGYHVHPGGQLKRGISTNVQQHCSNKWRCPEKKKKKNSLPPPFLQVRHEFHWLTNHAHAHFSTPPTFFIGLFKRCVYECFYGVMIVMIKKKKTT